MRADEPTRTIPTTEAGSFDISGYVRRVRRLADLNQRELAVLVGVDQSTVSRVEGGGQIDVRVFARVLGLARLRLCVVDERGRDVAPMPSDVFHDQAGRRRPAHLDVHAAPEWPTMRMLLHAAVPVPPGGAWHHHRPERDRLRATAGRDERAEQLSVSTARARRAAGRVTS